MILWLVWACGGGAPATRVVLGHELSVDVVSTEAEREAGLTARGPLSAGEGLVLRYPTEAEACITTAAMSSPIDVYFVGAQGRVVSAACARGAADPVVCAPGVVEVLETTPITGCASARGGFVVPGGRSERYVPYAPLEAPLCEGVEALALGGRLELRWFVGPGVSDEVLRHHGALAQSYWGSQGLWLEVTEPPLSIPTEALLVARVSEVDAAMEEAGLPLRGALTEAQRQQAEDLASRTVLAPLRAFVREHSLPYAPGVVNVVVLPHLSAPRSAGDVMFKELGGLTVSPWWSGRAQGAWAKVQEGLPERYIPTVFLSADVASRHRDEQVELTLAHELGHALGLPHVEGAGSLMSEGRSACVPGLSAAEGEALLGFRRSTR